MFDTVQVFNLTTHALVNRIFTSFSLRHRNVQDPVKGSINTLSIHRFNIQSRISDCHFRHLWGATEMKSCASTNKITADRDNRDAFVFLLLEQSTSAELLLPSLAGSQARSQTDSQQVCLYTWMKPGWWWWWWCNLCVSLPGERVMLSVSPSCDRISETLCSRMRSWSASLASEAQ